MNNRHHTQITLSNTPFAWMLAAIVIGIIVGSLLNYWWNFAIAILPACIILLYRKKRLAAISDIVRSSKLARWQYALLIAAIGILTATIHNPGHPDTDYDNYTHMQGEIVKKSSNTNSTVYLLKIETVSNHSDKSVQSIIPFTVRLYLSDMLLNTGDVIELPLNITSPRDNPNFAASEAPPIFPSEQPQYISLANKQDINILDNRYNSVSYLPVRLRDNLLQKIDLSNLHRNTKGLLSTMLLADKDAVAPEMKQNFADAGIAHILAVSGLHVGIIASIILILLWPLRTTRFRKARFVIAIAAVWGYVLICGMPPSAVRAAVMISLCLVALMLERPYNTLNALCAATFIILLFSPFALYAPSLQFSFIAVFALIVIVPAINPITTIHRKLYRATSTILASVSVSIACLGLTAYRYGYVPIMFLPANILILPLLPIYIALSIFYIVMLYIGVDISFIAKLLNLGAEGISLTSSYIAESSAATIPMQISIYTVILYSLMLLFIGIYIYDRHRIYAYLSIVCITFTAISILLIRPESQNINGYIVTTRIDRTEIRHYLNGVDSLIYPDQDDITQTNIHGHRAIIVAKELDSAYHHSQCDILIVGKGFRGKPLQLLRKTEPSVVVLCTGLNGYRAADIIDECKRLNIHYHDISVSGPYRHFY